MAKGLRQMLGKQPRRDIEPMTDGTPCFVSQRASRRSSRAKRVKTRVSRLPRPRRLKIPRCDGALVLFLGGAGSI